MSVENEMENATVGRLPDSGATTDTVSDQSSTTSKKKTKQSTSEKKASKSKSKDSKSGKSASKGDSSDDASLLDKATGKTTANQDEQADKEKQESASPLKKAAQTGAVVQGAAVAGKALLMAKFLMWMKMMMQAASAMLQSLFQSIIGLITTVVNAVVSAVVGAVTSVATALGTSIATAATGMLGVIGAIIIGVSSLIAGDALANEVAKYDNMPDCSETVEFVQENAAEGGDTSGLQLEYAQKIYSFYHEFGAPDEHIAGILGNWTVESGIDPTNIECSYIYCTGESYIVGPKKAEIFADLSDYTYTDVFGAYDRSGISINKPFYQASDGKYYCGLGLGQWTGENALKMLNAADSISMDWYSLDFQLIYTIVDGGYRVEWLIPWFGTTEDNPESAAYSFTRYWEGNVSMGIDARKSRAASWYVQFADWEVDADYANSLIELAGAARLDASDEGVEDALDDCKGERYKYDNSSIANAAVSYAWPKHDQGTHNNGTLLYQCVHDYIFGRGGYYASCCRGGSVAVRWSGSDDSFPAGGCAPQFAHVSASTKWERVCDLNGMSYSDICETLAPGDILICDNCHTLVWTGNEIIKKIHGEESPDNYVAVEASYGNKSPVCIPLWDSYYKGTYSDKHGGPHHFIAWRCIDPDRSDTYANAADGASTYTGSAFDPNRYP